MAQTIDQHVKILIGDLVLQIAKQAAQIDVLSEQLAQHVPPTPPEAPKTDG